MMTIASTSNRSSRLLGRYRKARRRDRQVYVRSHPVLFALLPLLRHRPAVRVGKRVVVNSDRGLCEALTEVPLDRTAVTTTGGIAANSVGLDGTWFGESGQEHRTSRRSLAARLNARGIDDLRPIWQALLDEVVVKFGNGETIDVVSLASEISGQTLAALLERPDLGRTDCLRLAAAARYVAWRASTKHLPGLFDRWRRGGRDHRTVGELASSIRDVLGPTATPSSQMLAIATVNTMYAALPRVVAWSADAELWAAADEATSRSVLVGELLRVVAPSPLLPRVAAGKGTVAGCPVHAGDQLLIMARHAVRAHDVDPDINTPVEAAIARLIFGAGSHACPGAGLARAQTDDLLAAFAPYRPTVVRARADPMAALPAWGELNVVASRR